MAEDDPLMSRMYERAFRTSGYDITIAFDGQEATTRLKEMDPKPSLVILDVMMPKLSGFDVLRTIKQDEKLKNIPVVLLTNLAGQQDAEKGLGLGAVAYLVKSQYSPKQIIEKIEEIMNASKRDESIPEVKTTIKDINNG